uniref:Uncharacterized protein n=1 Tax=Sphaerodactylus townsendi TaxID=933632 RepID=A0ACB8EMS2_9SAUR
MTRARHKVVDGIEDGSGSDKPMFSFRVGTSGLDYSSPSPGTDSGLLTIPPELSGADTIEKLRQAVAELSGQVQQMREGLHSLRQTVQCTLSTLSQWDLWQGPMGVGPTCWRELSLAWNALDLGANKGPSVGRNSSRGPSGQGEPHTAAKPEPKRKFLSPDFLPSGSSIPDKPCRNQTIRSSSL